MANTTILAGAVGMGLEALSVTVASASALLNRADAPEPGQSGPYRPAVWSRPAPTVLTVPPARTAATYDANGVLQTQVRASTSYVFDAVLRIGHNTSMTITSKPIQTGANIADHAYQNQARIGLDIGMSDAMDSYASGMWTGASSKSVSAYQTLQRLMQQRVPLTLTTRLNTYSNCLIESVDAPDTNLTRYGLKAAVVLKQIFTAQVASVTISARPQTTDTNDNGTAQGTAPTSALSGQHQIPSPSYPTVTPDALQNVQGTVPNAGKWSSNNLNDLLAPINLEEAGS